MDLPDTAPFVVNALHGQMPNERDDGRAGMTGADGRETEKLRYIGLGLMGLPMAGRLLNAGHDVTVWNRSTEKAAALIKAGARFARGPCDAETAARAFMVCGAD